MFFQYFASPCYIGFGKLLNVPVILVSSFLEFPYLDIVMGNPLSDAFFSGFFNEEPTIDTFFDRLWNVYLNYKQIMIFEQYTAVQTDMMRKHLGLPHLPDIRELERQVAMALVNTHYSYHGVRPITPAVIHVGGLHVVEENAPKLSPVKNFLRFLEFPEILSTLLQFPASPDPAI